MRLCKNYLTPVAFYFSPVQALFSLDNSHCKLISTKSVISLVFAYAVLFYFLKEFLLSDLVMPGFLSKLYREIEILLLNKQNKELVNKKLEVIHAAFANYEGAHIPYMESLDNMEEIQRNTGV